MKNFNIQIQDSRDHKWYTVSDVSFRFHKNHPSDGIRESLTVLGNDGLVELAAIFIEEIKFSVW